ncbi:MAG TPA: hypothetical protein VE981_05170 [Planctomycetota bacterium]|nr:hypothetical protein [Planctomycetota bacterium]
MAGHFFCIGIPTENAEDLGRTLPRLMEKAEWNDRPGEGPMGTWTDPSGDLVTFNSDKQGSVQCRTPKTKGRPPNAGRTAFQS